MIAKITYSNSKQIEDGLYQVSNFENVMNLQCIDRTFPDGELNTEVKRRGNIELPVESILLSKVAFRFIVLDSIKNVLEALQLHENVTIEYDGIPYVAQKPIEFTSDYEQGLDLHNVLITLSYDETVSRESIINETITIL